MKGYIYFVKTILSSVFCYLIFVTQANAQHMGMDSPQAQNHHEINMPMYQMKSQMDEMVRDMDQMMKSLHGNANHQMHGMLQEDVIKMGMDISQMTKNMRQILKEMQEIETDESVMDDRVWNEKMAKMHTNMQTMMQAMNGMIRNFDEIKVLHNTGKE